MSKKSIDAQEAFEKKITKILKESPYHLTSQRINVLSVFFNEKDRLLDIALICKILNSSHATIYRTVRIFEEMGIIQKIILDEPPKAYYFLCDREAHHHHFICLECKKLEDMKFCPESIIEKNIEKSKFKVLRHNFEVFGVCGSCQKKEGSF